MAIYKVSRTLLCQSQNRINVNTLCLPWKYRRSGTSGQRQEERALLSGQWKAICFVCQCCAGDSSLRWICTYTLQCNDLFSCSFSSGLVFPLASNALQISLQRGWILDWDTPNTDNSVTKFSTRRMLKRLSLRVESKTCNCIKQWWNMSNITAGMCWLLDSILGILTNMGMAYMLFGLGAFFVVAVPQAASRKNSGWVLNM